MREFLRQSGNILHTTAGGLRSAPKLYKRARQAERSLKRLEDKVTFKEVELIEGKTKIMREEPRDFSRIIAANINAEAVYERTTREGNIRLILGFMAASAAIVYRTYWSDQETEIQNTRRDLKDAQKELGIERKKVAEREQAVKKRENDITKYIADTQEAFDLAGQLTLSLGMYEQKFTAATDVIDRMRLIKRIEDLPTIFNEYTEEIRRVEESISNEVDGEENRSAPTP